MRVRMQVMLETAEAVSEGCSRRKANLEKGNEVSVRALAWLSR